jgi:hypothetical protein
MYQFAHDFLYDKETFAISMVLVAPIGFFLCLALWELFSRKARK